MGKEFDRIFREEQRRQRTVVGLIASLLLLAGFAPRNERAIFTQSGGPEPLARAFAAIAPDLVDQRGSGANPRGSRIFRGAQRPVLDAVIPPAANVALAASTPVAPGAPVESVAGTPGDGIPVGGSNSPNAFGSGPGPSFASLPGASPGGFGGNNPVDPGAPGGNPGVPGGPGGGGGTGPGDGNPVAPVPEAPVWLMLIFGLIGGKFAQMWRQKRLRPVRAAIA